MLNEALATSNYLVEDRFTATDIIVGYTVNWGDTDGLLGEFANLQAYLDRLFEREHCTFAGRHREPRAMKTMDIQGLFATRFSICVAACLLAAAASTQGRAPAFERLYHQNCAVCHGESFEGAAQGTALVGAPLVRGEGVDAIAKSIAEGAPDLGMPAWSETLGDAQIRSLAILIAEERANATFADFRMEPPLAIPDEAIGTKAHASGSRQLSTVSNRFPTPSRRSRTAAYCSPKRCGV